MVLDRLVCPTYPWFLCVPFNENPEELEKYVNVLGEEVRTEWNWEYIAEKYWKPVIEK